MYLPLPRRYRPQRFSDVVGQTHITRTLINAIRLNKIHHAYLFAGTRGTGKTSVARIFARALDCEKGPTDEPCLEPLCDRCKKIIAGSFIDVIEMDAGSQTSVDDIRQIRDMALFPPVQSKYKIFIIDESHMLSLAAFNALLKILEEPPEFIIFILATTEPHKIPETIHSRVLRFDFSKLSKQEIKNYLAYICEKEKTSYENLALELLALEADGSVRDALSMLEQVSIYTEGNITTESIHQVFGYPKISFINELALSVFKGDSTKCIKLIDSALQSGVDPKKLSERFLTILKDICIYLTTEIDENSQAKEIIELSKKNGVNISANIALLLYNTLSKSLDTFSYSLSEETATKMIFLKLSCYDSTYSIPKIVSILSEILKEKGKEQDKKTDDIPLTTSKELSIPQISEWLKECIGLPTATKFSLAKKIEWSNGNLVVYFDDKDAIQYLTSVKKKIQEAISEYMKTNVRGIILKEKEKEDIQQTDEEIIF